MASSARRSERTTSARVLLVAPLALAIGCGGSALAPDKTRDAAYVRGQPGRGALVRPPDWGTAWPPSPQPPAACPHDKEELEAATGLAPAEACGEIRSSPVPAMGDGDAPIAAPIAAWCYRAGDLIVVVEYEQVRTTCSRIVGMAV